MTFINVPYQNIRQLVQKFQCQDFVTENLSDGGESNFVLVDMGLYHGTYGGMVYDRMIDHLVSRLGESAFLSSSIGHGVSILWWLIQPSFVGDMALVYDRRYAAVPVEIYHRLTPKRSFSNTRGQSSYYGCPVNPKRITSESFSYSDSE